MKALLSNLYGGKFQIRMDFMKMVRGRLILLDQHRVFVTHQVVIMAGLYVLEI